MNFMRILDWVVSIIAVILLIASFPLKNYYGQGYCDLARLLGWAFLAAHFAVYYVRNRNQVHKTPV